MINIAFFSTKSYDQAAFEQAKNNHQVNYHFYDFLLTEKTVMTPIG
ncbi:hypothetical protein G6Z94_15950 [Vibrio aestuarianus]|nr:hypothetical protein [Vibrio aestuarianus]NGZ18815.1 hypothetical protein [Vibrio aestuarianus]